MSSIAGKLGQKNKLTNLAQIGRTFFWSQSNLGSNYGHHFQYSTDHPSAIGLDIDIRNNDASTRTVYIDGVAFPIGAGSSRSITNTPFQEIKSATGNIDIVVAGIYNWDL